MRKKPKRKRMENTKQLLSNNKRSNRIQKWFCFYKARKDGKKANDQYQYAVGRERERERDLREAWKKLQDYLFLNTHTHINTITHIHNLTINCKIDQVKTLFKKNKTNHKINQLISRAADE